VITTTPDRIRTLQGAGGKPFTIFVDTLIRTHAYAHNLPNSQIRTNIRVNLADGGVDTTVGSSVPLDQTGWLTERTVWQYKGTAYKDVNLGELLKGEYVRDRIGAGDAFRLAVADDMTVETRADWETRLWNDAKAINVSALAPRVVAAGDLAAWANRYPGLVLSTFFRELERDFIHLAGWGRSARDATAVFVPVEDWTAIQGELTAHIDFALTPPGAVRTVQGEAGVGKTRLAFEVVSAIPSADGLVIYTMDDAVLPVANYLVNDGEARAILVADECEVETRLRLAKLLDGHRKRVRVIAIDNTLIRSSGPDPELALRKMPQGALEEILATNFPTIDDTRRRAYVSLSEGFPRLAADLCKWDPRIAAQGGNISAVVPKIAEYYRVRLDAVQQEAMAALGLVTKIGCSAGVTEELDILCGFVGIERHSAQRALESVHDGPGFVGRSGRYLHVTPELIACVAFEDAWRRWAARDTRAFFAGVPQGLLDAFLSRVWRSAPEEVRRECAGYFRAWAERLTAADLADAATVHRLVSLVDTEPNQYFPLVRRIIESATLEQLQGVSGAANSFGGWGPRRALVWMAERFAQLPEHYDDAERILVRLAAAESEPKIGNNATAIWSQGFRIFLSGTATPFAERLAKLRERLRDSSEQVRSVAGKALEVPLGTQAMRMAGPAVVAGRIPPREWIPATNREARECLLAALHLLGEAASWDTQVRRAALEALLGQLRSLLDMGFLQQVRGILDSLSLSENERLELVDALDEVLAYDISEELETAAERKYADEITTWRATLAGVDLQSRLHVVVSKERWGAIRLQGEQAWQPQLEQVAAELIENPLVIESELSWLISPPARASGDLGSALAKLDPEASLFDLLLRTATMGGSLAIARGYADGLMRHHPHHADRLNAWLDEAERLHPAAAAEIAMSGGLLTFPLQRTLRLFEAGRVPANYLFARNFPLGRDGQLAPGDLEMILDRLATAAEHGDDIAARVGLDTFVFVLPYEAGTEPAQVLVDHPSLGVHAWRLLDSGPAGQLPRSDWWGPLIVHLGRIAPARASDFLSGILRGDSFRAQHELERAFVALSATHPAEVMRSLGTVMLDEKAGYRFFLGNYKTLFAAIPDEVKQDWIKSVGVEGARRMARHLPIPYVGAEGVAVVPALTAWVLGTFEDDERTFDEFAAGTHSWKWYRGDIAAEHEEEASVARRFLDYPLRRVREWAARLERVATADARQARQDEEEHNLP